ncbi:hypothetical protein quinque_013543 [Culex quinquefasciatus]
MSIEPSNETKTAAVETASSSSGTGAVGGGGGAEEEEELTLVEISPSSSSSSPTTVSSLSPSSRTVTISSSTGAGDDDAIEVHPEAAGAVETTRPVTTVTGTSVDSSSESSTIELVEEQPAKEQQQHRPQPLLAPVAADVQDVAPGDRFPHESRTILPIQSSSSLSTPSSSEEYFDESLTTVSSSTEGALNVSSSNNQLNNNNNSTAIIELQSVVVTSEATAAAATPEQSAEQGNTSEKPADNSQPQPQTKEAPIEIVQIFPSTKAADVSSSSTSTSGASSSSSSGASSESSSSSSPSVSPLAVDQQQQSTQQQSQQPSSPPSTSALVQGDTAEVVSKMGVSDGDDQVPELLPAAIEEVSSPRDQPQQLPILPYRGSASSPQLKQSSLKKYKSNSKKMNNDDADDGECEESSAPQRRVSFPQDAQLITGYLEPIDPWACVAIISAPELTDLYSKSCAKHSTEPLPVILEHIKSLHLTMNQRVPLLSLRDQNLNHGSCEALEEVLKRVQYKSINLSHAGLDDVSASVLFDMIEYYEATNELDFSDNLSMTNKSWLACINMIKKSQALNVLITRGPALSEHNAMNLAKALNTSSLHTLKLDHCELTQRPLATLCNLLKRNTSLKELSLAHNQLTYEDAKSIGGLLRSNYHIQLLDISNNNIGDKGVEFIVSALIDQSIYFKTMQETKRRGEFSFSDLSSSLQSINSNKNYFPYPYQQQQQQHQLSSRSQHLPPQKHPKQTRSRAASTKKAAAAAAAHKEEMQQQPASPSLESVVPLTPPPTPALPTVSSPSASSDDVFLAANTVKQLESPAGPLPPPAAELLTVVDDANSTNNDSGINSSVSSDVDQTNSENSCSNKCQEVVEVVAPEEASAPEEKKEAKTAETVVESGNERGNVHDGGGGADKQTIELTFDLEQHSDDVDEQHVKGPKKARLAKQDSVLSEFESSMPELKKEPQQVKVDVKVASVVAKSEEHPMEEDTPEICADYDDDTSLKIVEENLLVDRSINATSVVKEEASTDDSAPVTPLATFKKDELQLRLEKSKQKEEQELAEAAGLLNSSEDINKLEDVTSTSAPEIKTTATVPLKIVEVEIKDKQQPLSRSLDSTASGEFENPFLSTNQTSVFPSERSFSSESLNSETSVDSNDSKSSLKIIQSKFAARNGTLERQQSIANREALQAEQFPPTVPCGLQVLVLWNNEITRHSANTFADLIENTSTLEILNVGCNLLCNEFVGSIKSSLKVNNSLTNLGLQGAHLSDNGAKVMAEVIEFGGNSTLQRIDMRNNNILATGLDHLNEALKSNKTVTRIDLDDVPRRVVDNSIDVGPEYNRLLNNIRAQCERNKNPPEPSEPISTSIKRVRASQLNSRKISLTCTSIRAAPTGATAGEKHHHHLLDPSKKPGGRLRSPLPSPIPSPIASPVPSPSRNRFQVTRVGESSGGGGGGSTSSLTSLSNNKSTSPSPSSTGSSPTLFFAANSRFRVVTVEEPAKAKSSPVSSVSTNQRMSSSSSISPSPLAATVCSSSAPALSSFDSSLKSSSSPISQHYQTVATNTPSPPVLVQQQQQLTQSHFPPSLSPIVAPTVTTTVAATAVGTTTPTPVTPLTPPTPKPPTKHTRLPSTSSCTLHDSVISSTSIESPDLEVKRFMTSGSGGVGPGSARAHSSTTMDDSCCSSISSSIDSIDRVLQFNNNTSISSTDESFDLIVSSPSSSSLSVGSVSTAPLAKTDSTLVPRQQPTVIEPGNNLLLQPASPLKGKNASLSSLDMSTSSQESLYDVHDLSSSVSVSSGGSSSLAAAAAAGTAATTGTKTSAAGNSNESTLTSVQGLEKDASLKQATSCKQAPAEKPPRVRKTSWIASIGGGSHPRVADSGGASTIAPASTGNTYSPAVEKLLAIFNPTNLFSSSKSSPPSSECGTVPAHSAGGTLGSATMTTTTGKENSTPASAPHPPVRKESPMGGLFRWTTKSSSSAKDEEKVLKVNISPENTITPQMPQIQGHLQQHSPQSMVAAAATATTYNVDNIPSQLKAEIKENISPENTITNSKLLLNPSSSPTSTVQPAVAIGVLPAATAAAAPVAPVHPKVIFRLGDDYDESEDDIDTLTSKYGGGGGKPTLLGASIGTTTTEGSSPVPQSAAAVLMHTSHLGQLARDSLTTMFKNPSLASQDSIRSMDSLTEMAAAEQQLQQQLQPKPAATDDTQAQ